MWTGNRCRCWRGRAMSNPRFAVLWREPTKGNPKTRTWHWRVYRLHEPELGPLEIGRGSRQVDRDWAEHDVFRMVARDAVLPVLAVAYLDAGQARRTPPRKPRRLAGARTAPAKQSKTGGRRG